MPSRNCIEPDAGVLTGIMEDEMEKKMENEMDSRFLYNGLWG